MKRQYLFTTKRLGFSQWTHHDLSLALSLWGEEDVAQYITAEGRFSRREIEERLHKEIFYLQQYGVQYWPVFHLQTGTFIGCCGLLPYDSEHGVYELGIHLKRAAWGGGYASEACRAAMKYGFDRLVAETIYAGHHPENERSQKLLRRLGFHVIGEEYYPPTGRYHTAYRCDRNYRPGP